MIFSFFFCSVFLEALSACCFLGPILPGVCRQTKEGW